MDFTQLGQGGNAPESPQAHSQEITHVKMSSGEWVEIIKGTFKLYKTNKGVPFVEFKAMDNNVYGYSDDDDAIEKTVQLFPAAISGWAFDE